MGRSRLLVRKTSCEERGASNASAANKAASQIVTAEEPFRIATKCIKPAFESDNTPAFGEWRDEWAMLEAITDNFAALRSKNEDKTKL